MLLDLAQGDAAMLFYFTVAVPVTLTMSALMLSWWARS